jgi:Undecaprenyl-phosphate glucose phosphotransferase
MHSIPHDLLVDQPHGSSDVAETGSAIPFRASAADQSHPRPRPLRSWWRSPEMGATAAAILDFCIILTTAVAAFIIYVGASGPVPKRYIVTALFAATLFITAFERLNGYRLKQLSRLDWQLRNSVSIWFVIVLLLTTVAFFLKMSEEFSLGWALAWINIGALALFAWRTIFHFASARWLRDGYLARSIAIVGAGNEGQRVIAKLQRSRDPSVSICGVFDDRKSRLPPSVCGLDLLGTTDDLIHFAQHNRVDEVIVAMPLDAEDRLKTVFGKLKGVAIDLRLSVDPLARRFQVRGISYVGDVPVLEIANRPLKHWRFMVKWLEDKWLSAILLIWLAPFFAVIALCIKLDSLGPVFFVQERFGFNNVVIRVFKFRTMYVDRGDQSGGMRTIRNDARVTRVGRILRWLSLDELPQLVNVLRGDMSLVGPRPHAIAMKAGDRPYGDAVEQYFHRHRVRPGITGWAQVNGLRGEIDTLQKAHARVAHDIYYIDNWSLWLDLKILAKTVGVVGSRDEAY